VAIPDVNDVDVLSERLAAIVRDPEPAAAVGARGRVFARELQQDISFAKTLADICEAAVTGRRSALTTQVSGQGSGEHPQSGRFALTQLAAAQLGGANGAPPLNRARARDVLAALEQRVKTGDATLTSMIAAVEVEIAIAGAEGDGEASEPCDPLFRLSIARWALAEGDLARLVPVCDPRVRLLEFDYDVAQFMAVGTAADFPRAPAPRHSYLVAFRATDGDQRGPLVVDELTARILTLSDGTRTVSDILRELDGREENKIKSRNIKWIEELFVTGLLALRDDLPVARAAPPRSRRRTRRSAPTAAVP